MSANEVLSFPASVVRTAGQDELRRLALERQVIDEEYLKKYEPYFWPAEISSTRLDAHGTRMAKSTLENYARDAEAGVSFLYSHDNREIVGRSMGGRFVNGQGNGVARVVADFFTVRGFQLGSVSSDQIIFAIDSKMLRDVSVGFYGGEWMCSICGRDIWGMECRHWPLMKYEVEHDGRTETVMCTADVEDAHLAETSGVYKGSTPGAAIGKAEREAKDGRLSPEVRRMLETRFHMHLPEKRVAVPGTGEGRMSTTRENEPANPPATDPPPPADPPAADPPADPPAADPPASEPAPEAEAERRVVAFARTQFATANLKPEDAPASMRALVALAIDGKRYRDDLITAALAAGVRAQGDRFDRATYEGILNRSSIAEIKTLAEGWGAKGDELFTSGRQTTDGTELPDDPHARTPQTSIPPAYAAAHSAS